MKKQKRRSLAPPFHKTYRINQKERSDTLGVWNQSGALGEYALFTRPEMKAERVSYDVITPSAARGLLEAVYWKPAIRWVIDRIVVLNPIAFTNVRRNEVKSKLSAGGAAAAMRGGSPVNPIYTSSDIQQRASLVLKNVRYLIEAISI